MDSNLNISDKEEENSQETSRQPIVTHLMPPLTIPPETLKNFLGISDSIRHLVEQNQRLVEQFAKTTAFYEATNLRLMPEVLKIIETQHRLADFNKIISFPAIELTNTVNQSIERLLAADTVRINEILKQTAFQSSIWKEQQPALDRIAESFRQYDVIWRSHFLDIFKFAILSQTALSRIAWEQIGNGFDIQEATRNSLRSS